MIRKYVCNNCGHEMTSDKERKQCEKCKKRQLKEIVSKTDFSEFQVQVRSNTQKRLKVSEDGKVDGIYTRPEPVEGVTNVWRDDGQEGKDKANEMLKSFTKVSPRTRQQSKMIEVQCEYCKKTELIHPLHAIGSRYVCAKCISRRSKI